MANQALGVAQGVGAVFCVGLGVLALPSIAGSVPLFGLGLLLAHNAHAHLSAK